MKFIKLTFKSDNNTWVNMELVSEMIPNATGLGTTIYFSSCHSEGQTYTTVKENVDEILTMI